MAKLGPGMQLRGDRIHRYVNAFCPRCPADVPLDRGRAGCPAGWPSGTAGSGWSGAARDHGLVRTLYDESPEILRYLEQWTAPTKQHVPDLGGNFEPVPAAYLHGLPEMQTQHTCILLADLTDACNLRCPTCFTDSSPELTGVVPLARRAGQRRHEAGPGERPASTS